MEPQPSSRPNEPIAIIGTGLRFPGEANTPAKLWDLLSNPRDVQSVIPPARFNADGFYNRESHQGTSQTRHGYFLSEDHRVFDANFFGIKPVEAKSMDPQQRMLLEVIYEGLEAAGLSVETMRGSSTAVYVGLMAGDYGDMLNRDITDVPPYVAAGNARSMMSNRVSYVFDWCGPSMTIDTACSSSLVAVHHAVQSLRLGESRVAVAAGVNLILGPEQFIAGSNMKMMSPEGRSYMWDSRANGYARGEGVAAVVLKTLSAAIEDGDEIESVIVETGLNQDGRTKGLTVPSATAQTKLIEATYRKAGLDLARLSDRPQYFEAHGTGTPAGDPVEAQAIRDAFFGSPTEDDRHGSEPLYCGSIKTIVGHTEGTAGLAGLIKASLAVQRGVIPPNRLFEELAPSVKPFYKGLKIVTEAKEWPALALGAIRRASVNSFGFGGTNAHCILENYLPVKAEKANNSTHYLPFVFSAASEKPLMSMLSAYSSYLKSTPSIDLRALSYTLASKRTTHSVRATFSASNVEALCSDLEEYVQGKDTRPSLVEPLRASSLRILGIFTGQGAQWAGMGRMLMQFPAALDIIDMLERSLAELPDPPSWSLKNELAADASCSRVREAAIAQPICTAAQILLVEILRAAGIRFSTVVGHSSGEIAAAFAADRLSARDAIRISYYRGVHLPLVGGTNGEAGAMIAIGASYEEAQSICDSDCFRGKLCVGASNSAASVTLSGDIAAINDVKVMCHTQNKFARLLRVDSAYHSHHMTRCSEAITASVRACNITFQQPSSSACKWVSSVDMVPVTDGLDIFDYWHRNTIGCVFFSQALEHALGLSDYDIAVEVGAHPALKGPALQMIESVLGHTIPYTGLLSRDKDDTRALVDGLGYIWAHTGVKVVDFAGCDRFISGLRRPRVLKDLPLYPWDHEGAFWYESRNSHTFRNRPVQHELLGTPTSDFSTDHMAWKKYIVPKEIPWINGHQIQGQMIFPGSAYIVSAVEAAREAAAGQSVQLVELTEFVFGHPLVFDSEDTRIEVLVTLAGIQRHKSSWTARFTYHSVNRRTFGPMSLNADCQVRILFGQEQNLWSYHSEIELGMLDVDHERIYTSLARCGYHYAGAFKALHSVRRKIGTASGLIKVPERTAVAPILHPATVDAAIHSIAVAYSYPGDGRLKSVLLPIDVSRISIDLTQATSSVGDEYLRFTSFSREDGGGDVDMYPANESSAILRLEGLRTKPMAAMDASNDIQMFSETFWGPSAPMLPQTPIDPTMTESQQNLHIIAEIASQLSHRYPAMRIMSIGTCTVEATSHFLKRMNGVLSSYTHTDISCERLNQAKLALDCFDDKTIYKTLDMSSDLTEQDFPEYSFDLVVSLSNNAEILDLDHTLKTIRKLLRPGGFFICPRLAEISQLMPNIIDKDTRENQQPFAPSENIMMRAQTLENYGLAETEWLQELPTTDISQRPVMFLQAIDDRVELLREPLSPVHSPMLFSGITIVGGATFATLSCINKLKTALSAYSTSLAHVETLSNVTDSDFAFGGNVVVLQDHDKPLFADFTSSTLEGLQRLFRRSRDVLWVTHGYKQNSPHARMLVSFARCLVLEMPHIRLQILDFPSMETPNATVISESLLKLLITGKWEDEGCLADMLWSIEPEISHMNGHQYVPRMKVSESRNNRYNSTRRIINSTTDPSATPVALSTGDGMYALKIKKLPDSALKSKDLDMVRIRVKYSSLKAVKTGHFGNYYLVLGINTATNEQVIALSSTLCSVVDVPLNLVRSSSLPPSQAVGYLQALAFSLISITALEGLLPGQSLLVLEPHPDFAPILTQFAAARDVHVEFCTANEESHGRTGGRPWRYVPAYASKRYIKAALLGSTSSRVVCWKADDWTSRVLETLSKSATVDELSPSVIRQDLQICSSKTSGASLVLDCVQGRLPLIKSSIVLTDVIPLQLKDLHGSNFKTDDMSMVNWSNLTDVPVRVEPADQKVCFRSDRTYWLVGLTGELGLSLCEWMIARNARNIVLSSRSPDIDSRWIAHFASLGATVKIYSCDVADYNFVEKVHEDIKIHLPPVAGVCHGAMVLRDSLIQDLDLQKVNQVLKPKMNGAIHLDRVFQNQHLDFFIMLSSIAAVTGNPGQAAYAAGNAFLAAITAQRRARGKYSSCIALGAVLGNGYATRGLTSSQQISLEKAGVMWTSEQDFHTAFAEAVLASPQSPGESGEFGTGVPITYTDQKYKPKYSSNPIFSHLLLQRARSGQNLSGTPTVSTKAQLLRATTIKEVQHILDGFLELRLRKALQMVPDANVLEQTAEALGIDSLISVEIKSWLMRELGVDMPVLVIIGGKTMRGVLAHCVQLLDPVLIPQLNLTTNGSPTKSVEATESPTRSKVALHPLQAAPSTVAESGAIRTSLSNADDSLLESSTAKIPASAQIGIISKGEREIHTLHQSPARSVLEAMASNVATNGNPVAIKHGDPIFPGDTLAKVPILTTSSRGGSTEGGSMQSHDGKAASAQTLRMPKLARPSRTSRLRKAFMKRFSLV